MDVFTSICIYVRLQVLPEIPSDRIVHVNFANVAELNDYHKKFYLDTAKSEFNKLITELRKFEDEIAPIANHIRELVEGSYSKDLKKKDCGYWNGISNWISGGEL